jgi:hypothetical protein
MPKKSCMTNLLEFFKVTMSAVDNRDAVEAVFLDFPKAFDIVSRKRLTMTLLIRKNFLTVRV